MKWAAIEAAWATVTEGELKVARAHCALFLWQPHDATKPLPSSLVEYQFQSITGEAMTTEHRDEFKKMLPEALREKSPWLLTYMLPRCILCPQAVYSMLFSRHGRSP